MFCCRTAPTLTRKQKKSLKEVSDYVQNVVKNKKVSGVNVVALALLPAWLALIRWAPVIGVWLAAQD